MQFQIVVLGKPAPAGSKRAFRRGARTIVVDANPNAAEWKRRVADAASEEWGEPPYDGPLIAHFTFTVPRPKSHFTSKGELNALGRRTPYPTVRPDLLKLARGVEDALTGIVYTDDARIVMHFLDKRYGERHALRILLRSIP